MENECCECGYSSDIEGPDDQFRCAACYIEAKRKGQALER
jgi:hypothetical protein